MKRRSFRSRTLLVMLLVALPLVVVAFLQSSIFFGRQRLKSLCDERRLPFVYNQTRWNDWKKGIDGILSDSENDRERMDRIHSLASRSGVFLTFSKEYPYHFPYQGIWVLRLSLVDNQGMVAVLEDYTSSEVGLLAHFLMGRNQGVRIGCDTMGSSLGYSTMFDRYFYLPHALRIDDLEAGKIVS